MNILFLVDSIASGGAGRVVSQLASEMSRLGNIVTVMTMSSDKKMYALHSEVKFEPLFKGKKISPINKILLIHQKCVENNADVLISFMAELNVYSILASLGARWKVVVSERNDPATIPSEEIIRVLRKMTYNFADGYVFQTKEAKEYFSQRIQRRSTIIYNPLSCEITCSQQVKRVKTIVGVGRLSSQKNFSLLISAFASIADKYVDYTVDIYGDGPLREKLEELAKAKGLSNRVIFHGQVENLLDVIRDSAVFVMSSDYEGMSNALIEALALGLPVISTDHAGGGAKELIIDGFNGLLVPVGDEKALAEKIDYVLANPDIGYNLSKNAISIREKLALPNVCNEWLSYINSIK